MLIIGVGKDDRVGKDTFLKIVKKLFSTYSIDNGSYASSLKLLYAKHLDIDVNKLEYLIKNDFTYREGIRDFASNQKKLNPRIFIDDIMEKINNSNAEIFIITDLRFRHELQRLKHRPDDKLITIMIDKKYSTGNSNLTAYDFDYIIDNNHSLKDYEEQIKVLMMSILKDTNRL